MRIYVASHDRWAACHVAEVLERHGHTVTSRWHSKEFLPTAEIGADERPVIAQEDYNDIAASDALVLIAGPDRYSGGKFVEAGIAVGLGRRVYVIGRRENMLMWLPSIVAVDSPQELCESL